MFVHDELVYDLKSHVYGNSERDTTSVLKFHHVDADYFAIEIDKRTTAEVIVKDLSEEL